MRSFICLNVGTDVFLILFVFFVACPVMWSDPGPVLAARHQLALILGMLQVPLCQQNPRYSKPQEGRNEQINRIDES